MKYDILCVCSGAQLRAPYLARYLNKCYEDEGYKAESAGIDPVGGRNLATQEMIDVALVVVSVYHDIAASLRERFDLSNVELVELEVADKNPPFRTEEEVHIDIVNQIGGHLPRINRCLEMALQQ